MNKKIILFDVDDTIIETHKMALMFYEKLAIEFGTTTEKIIELKEQYKSTLIKSSDYLPNELMLFLGKKLNKDIKEIKNPFKEKNIYKKSLHSDVEKNLKKLSKNFRLGIYSEGFDEYQKNKIYLSGIGHYFEEGLVFIDRNKSDPKFIETLPSGVTIIDDKKEKLEVLKKTGKFNLVWINRKDDEIMDGVITVRNLNEFADLLLN